MGKSPAFQFYPGDWVQDTRILTPLTRGIWIDMLCFMWRSDDRGSISGTVEQLARMLSCNASEIAHAVAELSVTKIADVTERNDFVTVTNRRMHREEKIRKQTRCRVERFRNADVKRECNGSVTAPSSSSSSSSLKKEKIQKEKIEFDETKKRFVGIPGELMTKWRSVAPAVNIQTEITKAEAWVIANPTLKKSNWSRFLNNWIVRAQDNARPSGGNNEPNASKWTPPSTYNRTGPYRRDYGTRGRGGPAELPPDVQRTIDEVNRRARARGEAP